MQAIHDYIAQSSANYARLLTANLFDRTQILASFPEMGRRVPEYKHPAVRELIEGSYRIIYEIMSEDLI